MQEEEPASLWPPSHGVQVSAAPVEKVLGGQGDVEIPLLASFLTTLVPEGFVEQTEDPSKENCPTPLQEVQTVPFSDFVPAGQSCVSERLLNELSLAISIFDSFARSTHLFFRSWECFQARLNCKQRHPRQNIDQASCTQSIRRIRNLRTLRQGKECKGCSWGQIQDCTGSSLPSGREQLHWDCTECMHLHQQSLKLRVGKFHSQFFLDWGFHQTHRSGRWRSFLRTTCRFHNLCTR